MTRRRFAIPTRKSVRRYDYAPAPRRGVRTSPMALVGLAFLGALCAAVLVAPHLAPYDPLAMVPSDRLLPPSSQHWAGTDPFGRDVASRLLYGGRATLAIGVLAVALALVPGTALGLVAGYYGRWADTITGWVVNVLLSFPTILLALTIVAILGPGFVNVVIAVSIASVAAYVRLVRGQVLAARRKPYVRAAETVGCTDRRILLRHILPNVLGPVAVLATMDVGWAILGASALGFLGLGIQPPAAEWGAMLNEGRGFLRDAPWLTVAPGLMIAVTVLAVNLLGDGLRRGFDPRWRSRR